MSDRRENSVLFSLKELRQIEDDRVRREQDEAKAREDAARRAQEEAVRRAREDEENRKRAEEDRLRRIEDEKLAREREERMRLDEAERKHRIDAESRLREEKMRLEVQAAAQSKSSRKPILIVTAVLVAVAGGLGWKMYKQHELHQAETAAYQQSLAAERERAKAAQAEYEKEVLAIRKDMDDKLHAAKSEAERAQILQEAKARQAAAETARSQHAGKGKKGTDVTQPNTKTPPRHVPGKATIGDNPLEGL